MIDASAMGSGMRRFDAPIPPVSQELGGRSKAGTTKSGTGAGTQYVSRMDSMMDYEVQCRSRGLPERPLWVGVAGPRRRPGWRRCKEPGHDDAGTLAGHHEPPEQARGWSHGTGEIYTYRRDSVKAKWTQVVRCDLVPSSAAGGQQSGQRSSAHSRHWAIGLSNGRPSSARNEIWAYR